MGVETGGVRNPLIRLVSDERVFLRAVWVVAALVMLASIWASTLSYENAAWVTLTGPLFAGAALYYPRWRTWILSVGVGFAALWTPDASALQLSVAALMLLALVGEERDAPSTPWIAGVVGSAGALLLAPDDASIAPFLAVAVGGGVGLLARAQLRTLQLTEHTEELEQQTRWLEQRTALARELHDVVGHHVTAMVVQAEAGLVGEPERALGAIGDLGRTALSELDALVVHLRDPDAALTVTAPPRLSDIDELLAAPLRLQGVDVRVRIGDDLGLDEVQVLTVYRIVQEALTNVARHARASAAAVEVVRLDRHLQVRVTDDGIGTPPAPARGSGLLGIEERVAAQGGSWEIAERLGGGTVVDVVLPVGAP